MEHDESPRGRPSTTASGSPAVGGVRRGRPGAALMASMRGPKGEPDPAYARKVEQGGPILLAHMARLAGHNKLARECRSGQVRGPQVLLLILDLDRRTGYASRALRMIGRGRSRCGRNVPRARSSRRGVRRRSSRRGTRSTRAGPGDSEGEPSPHSLASASPADRRHA
jgi:hypothetical protein